MNSCLHKDPHMLSNYCTSLQSPYTVPLRITLADAIRPVGNLPNHQPLADDTLIAPGAADQPDEDNFADQLVTAPLLAAATVEEPGADDLLHQPILPIVPELGDQLHQQHPEPLDQDHGQLGRSRRVARKRVACLNLDNF